jgi:hypothetical protein
MENNMTLEEKEVMENIVEAWNKFIKLPDQFDDDIEDFRFSIHLLERILATRIIRRSSSINYWNQLDK